MSFSVARPSRGASTSKNGALAASEHRVRNGVVRREKTRRRLLKAAISVFAEKGIDTPSIDDFIQAAGVARGTFYNYFSTTRELLDAVTAEVSNVVVSGIEAAVSPIQNPLERLSCAALLYMHLGVDLPDWGAFVMHTGMRNEAVGKMVDVYLPRDLELARRAGDVSYPSVRAARDLLFASVNQAVISVNSGAEKREHLRHMLVLILCAVGVNSDTAESLSRMELPTVDLDIELFGQPSREGKRLGSLAA